SRIGGSGLLQDRKGVESFETANNHEAIKCVFLEVPSDHSNVLAWEGTVGTNLRTAPDSPTLNGYPVKLSNRIVTGKTGETVVNGVRFVSTAETVGDSSTGSSVHTTGSSTDVNDGNLEALGFGSNYSFWHLGILLLTFSTGKTASVIEPALVVT